MIYIKYNYSKKQLNTLQGLSDTFSAFGNILSKQIDIRQNGETF